MSANELERMHILQMIEDGKISAADGLRLLDALGQPAEAGQAAPLPQASNAETAPRDPGLEHWRRWWMLPMWIGTGVLLAGALLMYAAYAASGFGFWFLCAALPFTAGVLLMALAASSRSAKWLHLRVNTGQDEWPRNISISFPLPIRITAWALRTFGQFIPQLRDRGVDELILALAENTSAESPLYVDVDEGEGGEKVQVYIG